MVFLKDSKPWAKHPNNTKVIQGLLLTFLCLVWIEETTAQPLPLTATFSSFHQNTQPDMDTTMVDQAYFTKYFGLSTGSTYVFQLWLQPSSTEGPSVYLFTPTATHTSRRMGLLNAYEKYYCRAVILREKKDLFLIGTGSASLQVHYLTFNTLANTYAQASWNNNNSIAHPWALLAEPMFTDYLYFIDGLTRPVTYLHKWDTKNPARDPGPGITMVHDVCRSWTFVDNYLWIYCKQDTKMIYVERTTLTTVKTITGATYPRDTLTDYENPQVLFANCNFSPWGVVRLLIGATSYVATHTLPQVAGATTADWSQFVFLGKTGYIGFIRTQILPEIPFMIYSKDNLVQVSTALYQPRPFPNFVIDSFATGLTYNPGKYEINFGLQVFVDNVYNFQSWKLIVDVCLTRIELICTACPPGYYIDKLEFLDNSCLPEKYGHDEPARTVVPCDDSNCQYCSDDFRKCTKCVTTSTSPFRFESRCISFSEIPVKYGINPTNNEVLPCVDPNCVLCKSNIQICIECDTVFGYTVSQTGTCEMNEMMALRVISVFYDWRQQTAAVEFDSDIQLSGSLLHLNITVMDVNTSREYTCEQLDCVKQVQSRGVSVKFEKMVNVTKVLIKLHSNPQLNISRVSDSRLFVDYPVEISADIPVAALESTKTLAFPASGNIYKSVKSIQLPSTLFFAAIHPSYSVLFDETFARITTIALYASPPMRVLDEAILSFKDITIIPFQFPNLLSWLLSPNNCEPSLMLKRYEYECQFAENFGVDLTIFLFMTTLTVALKMAAKLAKRGNKDNQKIVPIYNSRSHLSHKKQDERVERTTLEQKFKWLDRNWGFMLLWAKVEGKQAEYLVFAFQDFWSNDGSKNRILSTLVATVCLLHVIFSLLGTHRLVLFITSWYDLSFSNRVTQKLHLPFGEEVVDNTRNLDLQSSKKDICFSSKNYKSSGPGGSSESIALTLTVDPRRIIELSTNKQLETTWFYPLRFWYDQIKFPDSRIQLRVPLISTLKNVATALLVIGLPSQPKIQCLGGIAIEVMWFLFKFGKTLQTALIDVLAELLLSIAATLFLMGKYFSYSLTEEFLQEKLAIWMLTIILVMMLVTALVTILSVAVWAYEIYSKKKASKVSRSSDGTCFSESTSRLRKDDQTGSSRHQRSEKPGHSSPQGSAQAGESVAQKPNTPSYSSPQKPTQKVDSRPGGFSLRELRAPPNPIEPSQVDIQEVETAWRLLRQSSPLRLKTIASNSSISIKLSKKTKLSLFSPRR